MDSKAQFVEQLQQLEKAQAAGRVNQQQDVASFKERMSELGDRIRRWLQEVPSVQLDVARRNLFDTTLIEGSQREYPIDFITIKANGRSLQFKPAALYLSGAKGLVELDFQGVRRQPECTLYMEDAKVARGEWALVTKGGLGTPSAGSPAQVFDESAFFTLMGRLLR